LQELDETDLWLELLGDAGTMKSSRIKPLRAEVDELISIFVTMIRKIRGRR
jgi:four helix bundle protein